MLATGADIHVLRDPTRGGVAASLNEIARAVRRGGRRSSSATCPIPEVVANACGLLGLDPLQVANEGKLRRVRAAARTPTRCSRRCGRTRSGREAAVIGECVEDHPGMVSARTAFGGDAGGRPADRRAAAADLLRPQRPGGPSAPTNAQAPPSRAGRRLTIEPGGGGGNRTRVRQRGTRTSPGAVCCGLSQPRRSRRRVAEPGSVTVHVASGPVTGPSASGPLVDASDRGEGVPGLTAFHTRSGGEGERGAR